MVEVELHCGKAEGTSNIRTRYCSDPSCTAKKHGRRKESSTLLDQHVSSARYVLSLAIQQTATAWRQHSCSRRARPRAGCKMAASYQRLERAEHNFSFTLSSCEFDAGSFTLLQPQNDQNNSEGKRRFRSLPPPPSSLPSPPLPLTLLGCIDTS